MACSKNDSGNNEIIPETSNAYAFFSATIGDQTIKYIQENKNVKPVYVNNISNGYRGFDSDKSFDYGSSMDLNGIEVQYPSLKIAMHNMYKTTNIDNETTNFKQAFTSKPTNFITSTQLQSLTKGLDVSYTNAKGVVYTTLEGSQANSSISYISDVSGIGENNMQNQLVTGTVSCKLYNENNPNDVLTLTNGLFKLYFREFDLIF
jgi:hypothetical protein